jgi:energy-coupling factor transport system ATP-binding protein
VGGPVIRTEGLGVRRTNRAGGWVTALEGVTLTLESGELLVVLGRPGSGKTTLLECLAGLLPLHRGRVELWGGDGAGWSWTAGQPPPREVGRAAGLLFQYPERQLVGRTPLEDVTWGLGGRAARERVEGGDPAREALARAGLPESLWEVPVSTLSRGEKRRVALAGVLARRPKVLLLDEPSVGLDPTGQDLVWGEVASFRAEGGAVLVATHWPEPLLPVATRVVCLRAGRPLLCGTPAALLGAAAFDPTLRELLPWSWRLAAKLGREGPLPADAAGWGAILRKSLNEEAGLPRESGQPAERTPSRAS